jgi:hypothetical protein
MTEFTVGQAHIARIEETYLPVYRPRDIFSEYTERIAAEHTHWMAPHHYDPDQDLIKLSVHSWLLKLGKMNILIDCCCGNNKRRPRRPFWNMLDTSYLERLAAAGARPQDIDYVMCTHLHHDHVGWNTQLRDGSWVPTFPKARYVISKPDFEHYQKLDADPDKAEPVEFGTFRECVLPIVESGEPTSSPVRTASTSFSKSCPPPATQPATSCSGWKAAVGRRSSSATCFTISCKSITRIGISRRTRMPGRRGRAAARCSNIAPRAARWCCPATSARRSQVISRQPPRGSYRDSIRKAGSDHFS